MALGLPRHCSINTTHHPAALTSNGVVVLRMQLEEQLACHSHGRRGGGAGGARERVQLRAADGAFRRAQTSGDLTEENRRV